VETSSLAIVGNQAAMTMVLEEPHENGTLFASQGPHDSTVQLREETDVSSATNSTSVRPVTEDQLERASSIIGKSVKRKTEEKVYARYVENWCTFIHDTWGYTGCPTIPNMLLTEQIVYLVLWLEHLQESGLDIDRGIPALKHLFTKKLTDAKVFDSPQFLKAKIALRKGPAGARQRQSNRLQVYRSPMMLEMVEYIRERYWSAPSASLYMKATYLAIAVGFNFGLRAEAICHSNPGDDEHALRVCDCAFEDDSATRYGFLDITKLSEELRSGISVFRASLHYHKGRAIAESLGADPKQRDKVAPIPLFISRHNSSSESLLLDDLLVWSCISGISADDMLFSRTERGGRGGAAQNKRLLRKDITAAQKLAADHFGLPVEMFSSHSNRISAGTILKAAGHSSESIRQFGHWSSDAVFRYERGSSHDMSTLRDAERTRAEEKPVMTISDVKSMIPIGYQPAVSFYGVYYGKRHVKHGEGFTTDAYSVAHNATNGIPSASYKRFATLEAAEVYARGGPSALVKRQKTLA